ncbi:MAG: hypothetical protein AAFR37_04720 [Cyanobacteria bacterium J06628_3]
MAIDNIALSCIDNAQKLSVSDLNILVSQFNTAQKILGDFEDTENLTIAINSLRTERMLRQLDE